MLYCVWPLGSVSGADTVVLRPDGVIGGWAREAEAVSAKSRRHCIFPGIRRIGLDTVLFVFPSFLRPFVCSLFQEDEHIVFQAGTHSEAIRMRGLAYTGVPGARQSASNARASAQSSRRGPHGMRVAEYFVLLGELMEWTGSDHTPQRRVS